MLVWETRKWILFFNVFMAIFNGIAPVIGAFISANLINSLVSVYTASINGISRISIRLYFIKQFYK